MPALNNPADVTVSRATFAVDGRLAHKVSERHGEKRFMGYVARVRGIPGTWAYRTAGESSWTIAGFYSTDAVDRLQSAWHPQGKHLLPE